MSAARANRRFLLALCGFSFASVLLFNGVLEILPWTPQGRTVLDDAVSAFQGLTFDKSDSWAPMLEALQLERETPGRDIYEELFIRRGRKFQYPPSSLLVVEGVLGLGWSPREAIVFLNSISWALLGINALFVALIFLESWRRFQERPADAPSRPLLALGGALAFALTFSFYPVVRSLALGQVQTWLNALLAVVVWLWLRGHRALPGALTGLACAIKPQQGLLLVWGLVGRFWHFAAGILAVGGLALSISLLRYGWQDHLGYLAVLSHVGRHGEGFHPNQSLNGLLNRLLDNGNNELWLPMEFAPYHPVVFWGTLLSWLALILAALFWRRTRTRPPATPDFLIALLTFTLASPVAWEHHYGVLLPIFAWLTPALRRHPVFGRSTWWILGGAYLLASNLIGATLHFAHTPLSPLQSYLWLAALAVLALLYRLRERMGGAREAAGAPGQGPTR